MTYTCTLLQCRWLKASGVKLAGEHRQRTLAKELVDGNLDAEAAPMSFPLKGGGEEIRGVPFAYCPNLIQKVTHLLQQNKEKSAINL